MGLSRMIGTLPLLAALLVSTAPDTLACSCSPPPQPLAALARADAVFSGSVIGRHDPKEGAEIWSSADPIDYVFEILRVWKGGLGDTVVVRTARDDASCGYSFRLGKEYLVYATRSRDDPKLLGTSICTRTRELGRAFEDLRTLEHFNTSGTPEQLDRRIVEDAIEALDSDDQETRAMAAEALGDMGREPELALGALSEFYERGTVEDRRAAVSAVHWLVALTGRSDLAVPLLVSALADSDGAIKRTALFTVSRMEDDVDSVLPALIGRLDDEDPSVRGRALRAIGDLSRRADFDASSVLPAFHRLLEDEDPGVRSAAVGALPEVAGDTLALGPILDAIENDWSEDVRSTATWALGRLDVKTAGVTGVLVRALEDHSPKVRSGALSQLARMGACGADAVPAIGAALSDPNEKVRRDAVFALASLGREVPAAYARLRDALRNPFVDVRAEVPFRLTYEEFDASDALDALEGALADTSEEVRLNVVRALGELGEREPAAFRAVAEAAEDESARVRAAVASVLTRSWVPEDDTRRLLNRLLQDDDEWVRDAASRATARLNRD